MRGLVRGGCRVDWMVDGGCDVGGRTKLVCMFYGVGVFGRG